MTATAPTSTGNTASRALELMRRTRAAQGLDPERITDPAALAAIAAVLRGGDR